MSLETLLHTRLKEHFTPSFLAIHNDSAAHAGHNTFARTIGETHFTVEIVSDKFSNLPRVKRHQLVYQLFKEEMARENGLHALVIKAFAPEEYTTSSSLTA